MNKVQEDVFMRKFVINVNGTQYEVEVEEVGGSAAVQPVAAPTPKAAPAPQAAPAPAPKAAPAASPAAAGSTTVVAPMPGTILNINASAGASVKKGDVLIILEAMKMENEIMAPKDGVIASVNVTKGASVNSGDVLVSLN